MILGVFYVLLLLEQTNSLRWTSILVSCVYQFFVSKKYMYQLRINTRWLRVAAWELMQYYKLSFFLTFNYILFIQTPDNPINRPRHIWYRLIIFITPFLIILDGVLNPGVLQYAVFEP